MLYLAVMEEPPATSPPGSPSRRADEARAAEPAPSALLTAFWTVVGTTELVLSTVVLGLAASLVGWIPPRGHLSFRLARLWSRLWLLASGARAESHFEHPLHIDRGYVFMANHQSWYDIPALLATLPSQTRFLAKKGLFQVPVLGWSLYANGFIPVDRKDRASARETFNAAIKCLAEQHSILIFPEETRSEDGLLLPFKKGGLLLALKAGAQIVPVGLRGTRQIRPKGSWLIRPGRISVHYGQPIDSTAYGLRERASLSAEVRRRIAELSGLPAEKPSARGTARG